MTGVRRIDEIIQENADRLAVALENHMRTSFMPDARKELRAFSAGEAAELLGIDPARLRKLHFDDKIPAVEADARGRRMYTAADLIGIRRSLEEQSRKRGTFLPGRREGDRVQVIAVANYKGGSSKTTTSIHLAQRLALRGYRVLAIDIDPQGSLTTMFGYTPETEFQGGGNIYDAIRYEDPVPMRDVIRKTYFPNLDLAAALLGEADHVGARQARQRAAVQAVADAGDRRAEQPQRLAGRVLQPVGEDAQSVTRGARRTANEAVRQGMVPDIAEVCRGDRCGFKSRRLHVGRIKMHRVRGHDLDSGGSVIRHDVEAVCGRMGA